MKKILILITIVSISTISACNKPKEVKGADNAVTRWHKKQTDKIKQAEATVKKLNVDIKKGEDRAKELKNE